MGNVGWAFDCYVIFAECLSGPMHKVLMAFCSASDLRGEFVQYFSCP